MQSIQGILAGLQPQPDLLNEARTPSRHNASAVANAMVHGAKPQSAAKQTGWPSAGGGPAYGAVNSATAATVSSGATASASSSSQAAGAGSTITANDFLTLLVSELKNQDPTAPTDPSAYIDQLVQVNSLQQLISINQGIGSLGATGTTGTTGGKAALKPL